MNNLKGLGFVAQCWKTTVKCRIQELPQGKLFDEYSNTFSVNEIKSMHSICCRGSHTCNIPGVWRPGMQSMPYFQ